MPQPQHGIIKPEKLAGYIAAKADEALVLPNMMLRTGFEKYMGGVGDSFTMKVPGFLPARNYAFRNENRDKIIFDRYVEGKVTMTLSGDVYAATYVTDEQVDWDGITGADLLNRLTYAISRQLEHEAGDYIKNAPYNVTIGKFEQNPFGALVEARRVMDRFRADQDRILVVGSDIAAILLTDENISKQLRAGDRRADDAISRANLGTILGMPVVEAAEVAPGTAYVTTRNGFIMATAPHSAPRGAYATGMASAGGVACRWVFDYDMETLTDRVVANTYYGFQVVKDFLQRHVNDGTTAIDQISTQDHFVRAIKLTVGGSSDYPAAGGDLATFSDISDAQVWVPGTNGTRGALVPESDAQNQ